LSASQLRRYWFILLVCLFHDAHNHNHPKKVRGSEGCPNHSFKLRSARIVGGDGQFLTLVSANLPARHLETLLPPNDECGQGFASRSLSVCIRGREPSLYPRPRIRSQSTFASLTYPNGGASHASPYIHRESRAGMLDHEGGRGDNY
jgi:hypothetical protein